MNLAFVLVLFVNLGYIILQVCQVSILIVVEVSLGNSFWINHYWLTFVEILWT